MRAQQRLRKNKREKKKQRLCPDGVSVFPRASVSGRLILQAVVCIYIYWLRCRWAVRLSSTCVRCTSELVRLLFILASLFQTSHISQKWFSIRIVVNSAEKMIHTRDIHHRGESLRNTKNVLESLNLTLAGAAKATHISDNSQQNTKFFFQYFKRSVFPLVWMSRAVFLLCFVYALLY